MINILHVEPDVGVRAFTKQRLEEFDSELKIISVDSALEAISIFSSTNLDLTLIHNSPLLNPIELTHTLKEMKNKPIMVYSTEGEESSSGRILDIGADFGFVLRMSKDESLLLIKKIKSLVENNRNDELTSVILDSDVNAIVVEYEGKIIYYNSPFKKLFPGNNKEFIGKSTTYFFSESENVKLRKLLERGGESIVDISSDGQTHKYRVLVVFSTFSGNRLTIVILQNINTVNVYEQRLRLLHEFAPRIINERNIDDLVDSTLNAIDEIFDSEILSFLVVEDNNLVFLDRRWKRRSLKLSLGAENILTRSVREGRSFTNTDLLKEESFKDDIIIKSELSVPIKNNDVVVAVLDLRSSKPNNYTKEDIYIIEALGRYISCAYTIIAELKSITSSETQYRSLLDSLGVAVYVFTDYQYIYVNQRGAELLGYQYPSEISGMNISVHIANETIIQLRNILEKKPDAHSVSNYEMKLIKSDGSSIDLDFFASNIIFGGKSAYLTIETDIKTLKSIQEQLKKYTSYLESQIKIRSNELLEAQQFASAGKLASMMGHDLRSPLQSIKNATYLIQKQPERSEEMLTSINTSVDRALSMLEDLRYKTMETSLKIESIEINKLIRNILQDTTLPNNIDLDTLLDPDLKNVDIDSLKIRRVVDNLIKNALEAMPNGGKLIIESKNEGDKFRINVTDTGIGIPQDRLANLFKPFYTTKINGLGLGLAYSYKAIEAHGGTIEAESTIGQGTKFTIKLKKKLPPTMEERNNK